MYQDPWCVRCTQPSAEVPCCIYHVSFLISVSEINFNNPDPFSTSMASTDTWMQPKKRFLTGQSPYPRNYTFCFLVDWSELGLICKTLLSTIQRKASKLTSKTASLRALRPRRPVRELTVHRTFHHTSCVHLPVLFQAKLQRKDTTISIFHVQVLRSTEVGFQSEVGLTFEKKICRELQDLTRQKILRICNGSQIRLKS